MTNGRSRGRHIPCSSPEKSAVTHDSLNFPGKFVTRTKTGPLNRRLEEFPRTQKGGHSTFPSDDTISANRGGSDDLDLRAAGVCVCEVRHGNLWDDDACGVFCHPAGVSCLGRVGSGGGAGLANGYFLPARRAESLACLTR
jgi:hypothetical protein